MKTEQKKLSWSNELLIVGMASAVLYVLFRLIGQPFRVLDYIVPMLPLVLAVSFAMAIKKFESWFLIYAAPSILLFVFEITSWFGGVSEGLYEYRSSIVLSEALMALAIGGYVYWKGIWEKDMALSLSLALLILSQIRVLIWQADLFELPYYISFVLRLAEPVGLGLFFVLKFKEANDL
jgi:hypothetical protein